jgi:hypothetical protein
MMPLGSIDFAPDARGGFSRTAAETEAAKPAKSIAWRMEDFLFILRRLFAVG